MTEAVRALGGAFHAVSRSLWTLMLANLIAAVLSLPFAAASLALPLVPRAPGASLLIAGLLVTLLPSPSAAGLHALVRDRVRGERISLGEQWSGFRDHAMLALKAWVLSLLGTGLIIANLEFYPRAHLVISPFAEIVWSYLLLAWLGVQLYVYPLLIEQQVKRLPLIYRNAFLLAASRPLFTVIMTMAWLAIAVLGSMTGLVAVLGLAMAAVIQHAAAADALSRTEAAAT